MGGRPAVPRAPREGRAGAALAGRARRRLRPRPGLTPRRRRLRGRRRGRGVTDTGPEPALPHVHRGKVRDLYDAGHGRLLMVASDRLSAFDVVMAEPIPDKGRVLTATSAFWFDHLPAPNHVVSTDVGDFP